MDNRKYGALSSSSDPQQFSETWAGVFKTVGVLVSLFLAQKGVDATVANASIEETVNGLTLVGGLLIAVWQASNALLGAVKKIIVLVKSRE